MPDGPDIGSAYVRLRAALADSFETDAKGALVPALGRIAGDAALVAAGAKLFDFAKQGVDRLGELEKQSAQTAVRLKDAGGAAGVSADQVSTLAQKIQDLTGIDQEQVHAAENVILQFGNIRDAAGQGHDTFTRATKDSADLSVAMGTDVSSAATTLGIALQDPEQGMLRLRRAHVVLSESQKESIKQFENVGNVAAAQGVILDAVEKQVGGSAQAYGETLPGELARAQASLKDMKAEVVGGLAPAINMGAHAAEAFAGVVGSLPAPLTGAVGALTLFGGGALVLARPINDVIALLSRFGPAAKTAAEGATAVSAVTAEQTGVIFANSGALAANAAAGEAAVAAAAADVVAQNALNEAYLRAGATAAAAATGAFEVAASESLLATNSAAAVAGLYEVSDAEIAAAGTSGGFASKLGTAGVAGAALLAVGALYAYGQSLNKTTLSMKELGDLTKLTGDQSAEMLDKIAAESKGPFADTFKDALKGLSEQGATGVGVLESYRQHLVDTGQATTEVDAALQHAAQSQANLNANTAAGTGVLNANGTAWDGITPKIQSATDAAKAYNSAISSEESGKQSQLDNTRAVASAQTAFADAQRNTATAAKGVEQAERGVTTALQGVRDAQDAVTSAQEALNKAMQPADAESLGKGQLDISDANLRVSDATRAVNDAEKQLAKDRRLQDSPAKIAEDQDKLTKAQDDLQRATYGVTDANKALQDLQQKGTDQDSAVIAARKNLDTATRGLADATDRVATAQQGVVDAQDRLNSAYLGEATASSGLADAQDKLHTGVLTANGALLNQITALQGIDSMLAPGSAARQHLDDYITNLFILAGIFQNTGVGVDSTFGGMIPAAPPSAPQVFRGPRASGGPVSAGASYSTAEAGDELLLMHGSATRTMPSDGFVFNAQQTRQMLGGGGDTYQIVFNGPVLDQNAISAMVRHELDRHSALTSTIHAG